MPQSLYRQSFHLVVVVHQTMGKKEVLAFRLSEPGIFSCFLHRRVVQRDMPQKGRSVLLTVTPAMPTIPPVIVVRRDIVHRVTFAHLTEDFLREP